MTVVVTGACGHVGGNLVRGLLADGRRVRALIFHDERPLAGLAVERVKADVLDPASLRAAFAGADVVYHLAARISIDGDRDGMVERTNLEGTRNVVAACLAAKVRRVVHFSSTHGLEPLTGDHAAGKAGRAPAYERSKTSGEQAVQDAVSRGLDAVIINPTSIIGPFDFKPSLQGEMILGLCRRELPGLVAGGYEWVDVRDVARGAIAAEAKGRTGERYLLSGEWATLADIARLVEEAIGVPAPRFIAPMWLARLGAPFSETYARLAGKRPLYTRESLRFVRARKPALPHEEAVRDLAYQPRPLKETIVDTIAWFREAGMLPKVKQ